MSAAIRPTDVIRISNRALADQSWMSDHEIGLLGVGILSWLLAEPDPVTVERMAVGYDEPMQEILDRIRVLVDRGLVDVVDEQDPQPASCDLGAGIHAVPHRGCILR